MIWCLPQPYHDRLISMRKVKEHADYFPFRYPPFYVASLAGILRQSYDVKIVDYIAHEDMTFQDIKELYLRDCPEFVVVEITSPSFERAVTLIKRLYKLKPCKFYVFGLHTTYFKDQLKCDEFEIIDIFPELWALKMVDPKYKDANELDDLDAVAFPAWDLVDMDYYKLPLKNKKFAMIRTGIGCPNKCEFCLFRQLYTGKVMYRSHESVIKELEYIKNMGINCVLIVSDNFSINRSWVRDFCRQVIDSKLDMTFICNSRVDTINDVETIRLMKKAGFWLMSLGLESGNQGLLDHIHKGTTIKQIEETTALLHQEGIMTLGYFIVGLPGETEETLQQTIDFAKRIPIDLAAFYINCPLPGTDMYEEIKTMLEKNNQTWKVGWEGFDYFHNTHEYDIDLDKWDQKAFFSFYRHRPIRRMLRIIRLTGLSSLPAILFSALKLTMYSLKALLKGEGILFRLE